MGLEIKILAGHESKAFLVELEKATTKLENILAGFQALQAPVETPKAEKGKAKPAKAPVVEEEEESFEEELTSDDETPEETESEEDNFVEEEEETKPAPKKAKAPKITEKEVQEACKAKVKAIITARGCTGEEARNQVKKLLKKHFNTESISEIDPTDFEKVLKVMK